jgi:hypothetical protein
LAAPEFDLVLAVVGSSARAEPDATVRPIIDSAGAEKPLAAFLVPDAPDALAALSRAGVPNFRTPEACADAIAAALSRRPPRPMAARSAVPAALASEASGQRGHFISARAGHSPEPGSSARAAALASEASGQRGHSISTRLHALHCDMAGDIRSTHALRLGFRKIKGLAERDAKLIVAKRNVPYASVRDLWLRTGLSPRVIERLADADAFGSVGLARRQALWAAKALGRVGGRDDDLPLFRDASSGVAPQLRRDLGVLPLPAEERVGVRGFAADRETLTPHPTPLPMGEGADRIRGAC